jgi:hypothetical protein
LEAASNKSSTRYETLLEAWSLLSKSQKRRFIERLRDTEFDVFHSSPAWIKQLTKKVELFLHSDEFLNSLYFLIDPYKPATARDLTTGQKDEIFKTLRKRLIPYFSGQNEKTIYWKIGTIERHLRNILDEEAEPVLKVGRNTKRNRVRATNARAKWGTEEERLAAVRSFFGNKYKRLEKTALIKAAVSNCVVSESFIYRHLRNGDLKIPPRL